MTGCSGLLHRPATITTLTSDRQPHPLQYTPQIQAAPKTQVDHRPQLAIPRPAATLAGDETSAGDDDVQPPGTGRSVSTAGAQVWGVHARLRQEGVILPRRQAGHAAFAGAPTGRRGTARSAERC